MTISLISSLFNEEKSKSKYDISFVSRKGVLSASTLITVVNEIVRKAKTITATRFPVVSMKR